MKDLDLGKLRVSRDGRLSSSPAKKTLFSRRNLLLAGGGLLLAAWALVPGPVPVQTTQVVSAWPSQQFVMLNSTGYVVARRKAAVAPKGTGRIEWLGVSEGDFVKAGTVVARLEGIDVEAAYQAAVANTAVAVAGVASAQNELDDAQRNLDRINILFKKRLVSLMNLQDAKSRHARASAARASAQASLEAAKANEAHARSAVDYTVMRAPFDGVVIARAANVGDIVTSLSSAADAKGAAVVIADMSTLEVDAEVSESALAQIKAGQPCEIVLDAFPDRRYRGEVAVVVPAVNRSSATVTTKVRFLDTDPEILPDMSARVAFLSQAVDSANQQPVLAVSPEAVLEAEGKAQVFKTGADGRAEAVTVSAGRLLGGVREIAGEGLKLGDSLLLAAPGALKNGARIKLAESK